MSGVETQVLGPPTDADARRAAEEPAAVAPGGTFVTLAGWVLELPAGP